MHTFRMPAAIFWSIITSEFPNEFQSLFLSTQQIKMNGLRINNVTSGTIKEAVKRAKNAPTTRWKNETERQHHAHNFPIIFFFSWNAIRSINVRWNTQATQPLWRTKRREINENNNNNNAYNARTYTSVRGSECGRLNMRRPLVSSLDENRQVSCTPDSVVYGFVYRLSCFSSHWIETARALNPLSVLNSVLLCISCSAVSL